MGPGVLDGWLGSGPPLQLALKLPGFLSVFLPRSPRAGSLVVYVRVKKIMKVMTEERWSVDDMWKLRLGLEPK